MDNNNTDKVEGDQLPHSQSQNESHSLAATGLFSLPNPSFPQSRSPRRIRTETSESFARILVATTFATAELIEVSQDGLHFKTEKTPDILYQNRPMQSRSTSKPMQSAQPLQMAARVGVFKVHSE
jgi:hypothetical protein